MKWNNAIAALASFVLAMALHKRAVCFAATTAKFKLSNTETARVLLLEYRAMKDSAEKAGFLVGSDGKSHKCEIGPIFDLSGCDYGLIISPAGPKENQKSITTLLRVFKEDEDTAIFSLIESDEEFAFMVEHVRHAAAVSSPNLDTSAITRKHKILADIKRRVDPKQIFDACMGAIVISSSTTTIDVKPAALEAEVRTFVCQGQEYALFPIDVSFFVEKSQKLDAQELDEDGLPLFLDDDEEHFIFLGYGLTWVERRHDKVVLVNIERDEEFERTKEYLRELPPWAAPWRPKVRSEFEDPSDRISKMTDVYVEEIVRRFGDTDLYKAHGVSVDHRRNRAVPCAKLAARVRLPTGLLNAVPSVRSSDLTSGFFSQLKRWNGYAESYEIIVLEETDHMLVWLKGQGLLCRPPKGYRAYDWSKILTIFRFEGRCYLILRNGYRHGETERFLAAGYSLARVDEGNRQAIVRDLEGQGEFERVTNYLRKLSHQVT